MSELIEQRLSQHCGGLDKSRFAVFADGGEDDLMPDIDARTDGPSKLAQHLACTGRAVAAGEAVRIGLATRVCDDPLAESRALAQAIAQRSPRRHPGRQAAVQPGAACAGRVGRRPAAGRARGAARADGQPEPDGGAARQRPEAAAALPGLMR